MISGHPEIRSKGVSHRPSALLRLPPHSSAHLSVHSPCLLLLSPHSSVHLSVHSPPLSSCPAHSFAPFSHGWFSFSLHPVLSLVFTPSFLSSVSLSLTHTLSLSTFTLYTLFIHLTPVFLSCSDAEEVGELEPAKELIQPIAEKIMAKYKAKEEETPLLFFVAGEVR